MGEDKKKIKPKKEEFNKTEKKDINYVPKFKSDLTTKKKNTFSNTPGMNEKGNSIHSYSVNKSIEGSIGFSYFDDNE